MKRLITAASIMLATFANTYAQEAEVTTVAGRPWERTGTGGEYILGTPTAIAYRKGNLFFFDDANQTLYRYGIANRSLTALMQGGNTVGFSLTNLEFLNDSILIGNSFNGCFCIKEYNVVRGTARSLAFLTPGGGASRPVAFALDSTRGIFYAVTDDNSLHKYTLPQIQTRFFPIVQ